MNTEELVGLIKEAARQVVSEALRKGRDDRRLGKIDPAYAAGRPKVLFDGETAVSTKTYPYLSSYAPAANDRVALDKYGSTWVIVGRVV